MRLDQSDAQPPPRRPLRVACAAAAALSVALTGAVSWPGVTAQFSFVVASYEDGHFAPGFRAPFPPFVAFRLCVAAALAAAAADAAAALDARGKRIAEAAVAALSAVAVYAALGGCLVATAGLAALLSLTAALSDALPVTLLALAVTLGDPAFATGHQRAARAWAALSYAGYGLATEAARTRSDDLGAAVATAGRVTALWQSYAVLTGSDTGRPNEAVYLASALPLVAALCFAAFPPAQAPPPPPQLPLAHKKGARKRHGPSFRV